MARKLIGWFVSRDLRCASGILKSWDVFISMRRGRAWKKRARRTATASLPLWARIPRAYIWNNELERAKDAICEPALTLSLSHSLTLSCCFGPHWLSLYEQKQITASTGSFKSLKRSYTLVIQWTKSQLIVFNCLHYD